MQSVDLRRDDARQKVEHRPHTLRGPDAIALGFLDGVLVFPTYFSMLKS